MANETEGEQEAKDIALQALGYARLAVSLINNMQQQQQNNMVGGQDEKRNNLLNATFDQVMELTRRMENVESVTDNLGAEVPEIVGSMLPQDTMAPFNIYDLDATSFKIANCGADTVGVWMRGSPKTVGVGSGLLSEAVTGTGYWHNNGTVHANVAVYLEFDRATSSVKIDADTTFPTGSDNTMIMPLWFLPWDTDHIDRDNVWDLRHQFNLQGMV